MNSREACANRHIRKTDIRTEYHHFHFRAKLIISLCILRGPLYLLALTSYPLFNQPRAHLGVYHIQNGQNQPTKRNPVRRHIRHNVLGTYRQYKVEEEIFA